MATSPATGMVNGAGRPVRNVMTAVVNAPNPKKVECPKDTCPAYPPGIFHYTLRLTNKKVIKASVCQ